MKGIEIERSNSSVPRLEYCCAHTQTHKTHLLVSMGSNKTDTNKISHRDFMNNYRSFLFLYIADRMCFVRASQANATEKRNCDFHDFVE